MTLMNALLSACLLMVAACAAQTRAPGDVRFALMGDTPYSEGEVGGLDRLIDDLNREDLAFVVHVGDITSGRGPCTAEAVGERKSQFSTLRPPFVLLQGEKDWLGSHRTGYSPTERLACLREPVCTREARLKPEVQRGGYWEPVRWQAGNTLFVAPNGQGSDNNPGR